MSTFTHYAVTYTLDDNPAPERLECMTVKGETTTDDFPKMIGARILGNAQAGVERVTVVEFAETEAIYSLDRSEIGGTVLIFRNGERIGHFWPDTRSNGFAAFVATSSKPIARPKTERTCVLKITRGEWDGADQL